MKKNRYSLARTLCISLPIACINYSLVLASDIDTAYKDSSSGSIVTEGKLQVTTNTTVTSKQQDSSLTSVINCDIQTNQKIDLDPTNYRWFDEDAKANFIDPAYKSHYLRYAKLCVKYQDVDLTSFNAFTPELNVVQFGKTSLGVLPGNDGETLTKCWDVSRRVLDSLASHIPFYVNVDSAHEKNYWAVNLHYANLSTCHVKNYIKPPYPIDPIYPIEILK